MGWARILDPGTLALLIPILAVVFGGTGVIVRMVIRHRERLALIENGMDPDRRELPPHA